MTLDHLMQRVVVEPAARPVDPGSEDAPVGDLVGVTRQVVDRLLADRTWALRRLPGNKHRHFRGSKMSCRSPRNVIVAKKGTCAVRSAMREPADET